MKEEKREKRGKGEGKDCGMIWKIKKEENIAKRSRDNTEGGMC